jgi:hypothetical protein
MIEGVRPLLHPALVPYWRDPSTVQFGLSDDRAVIIGGLDPSVAALIGELDGFHTLAGLREVARARGADPSSVEATVQLLRGHGVLVDADASGLPGRDPTHALVTTDEVRAPDRVSAGLLTGAVDTGRAAMDTRADCHVEVIGAGRVGASIARLLVAAGIGMVSCDDDVVVKPGDVIPGGLRRSAVGRRRDRAVTEILADSQAAPRGAASATTSPDVAVIASDTDTGRVRAAEFVRAGTAHLLVRIEETTGVVGPLVVPGRTSCLRCMDLHRTDRDPGWPTVLHHADLTRPPIPACDVALATLVAGLAVAQVLGHVAGHEVPTLDGTIETSLPHALPRRRSWRPHPACGCQWPSFEDRAVETRDTDEPVPRHS